MQAIQTRYIGPTNHRGARIRVFSAGFPRGITVPWKDELGISDNHRAAVEAFLRRHEWWGVWIGGGMPDQRGDVYVCAGRDYNGSDTARLTALVEALGFMVRQDTVIVLRPA
jgi:hypothetical protein